MPRSAEGVGTRRWRVEHARICRRIAMPRSAETVGTRRRRVQHAFPARCVAVPRSAEIILVPACGAWTVHAGAVPLVGRRVTRPRRALVAVRIRAIRRGLRVALHRRRIANLRSAEIRAAGRTGQRDLRRGVPSRGERRLAPAHGVGGVLLRDGVLSRRVSAFPNMEGDIDRAAHVGREHERNGEIEVDRVWIRRVDGDVSRPSRARRRIQRQELDRRRVGIGVIAPRIGETRAARNVARRSNGDLRHRLRDAPVAAVLVAVARHVVSERVAQECRVLRGRWAARHLVAQRSQGRDDVRSAANLGHRRRR